MPLATNIRSWKVPRSIRPARRPARKRTGSAVVVTPQSPARRLRQRATSGRLPQGKAATGAAPKTCEVCGLTEGDVISYIPTGGSTIEWESGDITLTFKRSEQDELCFANYKETQIDKKTTKVSAKAGSTIITIDEATLKALGAGEHTITVVFADATSDVKLVIKEPEVTEPEVKPTEPEKVESPKTGDGLPMGVVTAMALVALLGAAAVTVQRRRGAAK